MCAVTDLHACSVTGQGPGAPSPSTAAQRRAQRRLTREDNRYHSGKLHNLLQSHNYPELTNTLT